MLAGGTAVTEALGPADAARSLAWTRLIERCHNAAESHPFSVEFDR